FCGRRLLAASEASPSDLFFAIAACLPCTTKLRQGSHTPRVRRTKKLPRPVWPFSVGMASGGAGVLVCSQAPFRTVQGQEIPKMQSRKIGVVLGGLSSEREVSLRSGEAVLAALRQRGHDAVPIYVDRDLDVALRQEQIEVAFIALHGRWGEDGCVQGLL